MPSTFPESFGMVAAEAAACGALPLSANHSGMAEVTATLRPALPEQLRPLMSFDVGPGAVREIGSKLVTWLELDPPGARRGARRAGLGGRPAVLLGERRGGRDQGGVRPLRWIVFPPREPHPQHGQAALAALGAVAIALSLGACGRNDPNLETGKAKFVEKCGSCHTLARARARRAPPGRTSTPPSRPRSGTASTATRSRGSCTGRSCTRGPTA